MQPNLNAEKSPTDGVPQASPSWIWRIYQFPLVLLAIGVALQLAVIVGYQFANLSEILPDAGPGLVVKALLISAAVLGAHWVFNRYIDADPHSDVSAKGAVAELGAGLGFGFTLFSLITGFVWAMGGYTPGALNSIDTIWPMLASVAILPGVTEEVLMRGLLFRYVERVGGSWIALIVSAMVFGFAHFGNPNAGLLPAIAITLEAGIMLAAVYMLTRRLWAAIGVHAAWNFTQGWVFGIPVSGIKEPGLINSVRNGPDWLTGGAFGLEASLVAMVLATMAGLGLLWMAHKKGRFVAPMWARKADVT